MAKARWAMIGRLVLGVFKGAFVGAALAAALVYGLHVTSWGAPLAYAFGAAAGVLVGLVAGKPIWARGAKIEAGLKAFFGAALGAAAMWGARKWLGFPLDLGPLSDGAAPLGLIPAASVSVVAMALAILYELDNTGGGDAAKPAPKLASGQASRTNGAKKRAAVDADELADDGDEPSGAKRKRR